MRSAEGSGAARDRPAGWRRPAPRDAELLGYDELAAVEVDVDPQRAKELAPTQPGHEPDVERGVESVLAHAGEELAASSRVQDCVR